MAIGLSCPPVPAIAAEKQPVIDPKTNQYTERGRALALVARAAVIEVQCFADGRIAAAVAKAARTGVAVDLNDLDDNKSIASLMEDFRKASGVMDVSWCKEAVRQIDADTDRH